MSSGRGGNLPHQCTKDKSFCTIKDECGALKAATHSRNTKHTQTQTTNTLSFWNLSLGFLITSILVIIQKVHIIGN